MFSGKWTKVSKKCEPGRENRTCQKSAHDCERAIVLTAMCLKKINLHTRAIMSQPCDYHHQKNMFK